MGDGLARRRTRSDVAQRPLANLGRVGRTGRVRAARPPSSPCPGPCMLPAGGFSSAYRKTQNWWQHHVVWTEGMAYSEPARTAVRRTRSLASWPSAAAPTMGLAIYGCGQDEA